MTWRTPRNCIDCGSEFKPNSGSDVRCFRCRTLRQKVRETVGSMTARAINTGALTRKPCEVCGAEKVDAHHDDYLRPLHVRWLCRKHHQQYHAEQHRKLTGATA